MSRYTALIATALLGFTACNAAPEGLAVEISPEQPRTEDDLVAALSAEPTDANGDPISLTYAWSLDGAPVDDLTEDTVPASRTARGQSWEVQVVASDGKKEAEAVTAEVTIANTPPTVSISLSPETPSTADPIVVSSTTFDADDDEVTVAYEWSVGGSASSNSSDTLNPGETMRGQIWTVTATPSDGIEPGEPHTVEITIGNALPSVDSASVQPAEIFESSTVTCAGEGWADVDGDAEDYRVTFTVDGSVVAKDSLTGEDFDKGSTISCTLTPYDGMDEGAPVTSAEAVVKNSPPVVVGLSLDPAAPTAADAITASYTELSDADGDPVTLTWSWTRAGAPLSETGDSIAAGGARGDEVVVTVLPNDGEEDGETAVASVTIANSPPELTGLTIVPLPLYTDSTAEASFTATDLDGDSLTYTYSWTSSGTVVGTSAKLDGSTGSFGKLDTLNVSVTADDGHGGSTTVKSPNATVQNSPPTAPVIGIDPSAPTTDDDLVCELTTASTDPDGDSLTYTVTWTLDGTGWTGSTSTTTYAGDTIDADDLTAGDEWTCTIVASDGTATASATSATATVVDCSPVSHSSVYTTAVQLHGYCWYLGKGGQSCDTVCAAVGGKNLANSAASAFSDSCSAPGTSDVSTWFYNNGNPAGWSGTGATGYKTLGYGYAGTAYYGKCASGSSMNHGTFPSDPNNSSTRTLACPCF